MYSVFEGRKTAGRSVPGKSTCRGGGGRERARLSIDGESPQAGDSLWSKQGDPREIEQGTNYGEEKPSGTVLGVVYTIVETRGGGWVCVCMYSTQTVVLVCRDTIDFFRYC